MNTPVAALVPYVRARVPAKAIRRNVPFVGKRRLARSPATARGTWSSRRLNALWAGMPDCSTYLEIGVQRGHTLEAVRAPFRWGVDPDPRVEMSRLPQGVRFTVATSDAFFRALAVQHRFDLVFLDGLHEWSQTYRDLLNALLHAHPGTLILIDDVVPSDRYSALPDEREAVGARAAAGLAGMQWHGDVYKAVVAILDRHPELEVRVIDGDLGNPQALVWSASAPRRPYDPWSIDDVIAEFDPLGYDDVFESGAIPAAFRMMDEASAVRAAVQASRLALRR